jgi:hypothetical protein
MRVCVLLPIGLALIGSSLLLAPARKGEPARGAAPSLQFATLDGTNQLALAPSAGLRHLPKVNLTNDTHAPLHWRGVPPVLGLSLPSLRGWPWVPTNSLGPISNLWVLPRHPPSFARGARPGEPGSVPPGVYESEPYTCIVVVPGPQWDDRCLVPGGAAIEPMPVVKPELRLVPHHK